MRVLIAGPGAIGCLFAARLAEAGSDVFLLDHDPARSRRLAAGGLRIERPEGMRTCRVRVVCAGDPLPPEGRPVSVAIVAVKAYDTAEAGRALAACIGLDTPVISVQNGIGNHRTLGDICGFRHVACGVTSCGATRLGDGHIREAGIGLTRIAPAIGAMPPVVRDLARALADAGLPVELGDDGQSVVWSKAVVNAAVNPVTALEGVANGECVARADLRRTVLDAAREAARVAAALGIGLAYRDAAEEVERVCRGTRDNLSSMLQDVRAGRRTEVRQINGAIVEAGRHAGVRTPVNEELLRRVLALEAGLSGNG